MKYSKKVIYEIIPNKDDSEYKRLINNIYNLNIDPKKKKFFIDQIEFKAGTFTYRDLYKLVNEYINILKNNNTCPYKNLYPIIISDKTYLNNIALFIACLKLNLKPVCIGCNNIPELEDKPGVIKNHSFGIYSSGSVKKKIVSLYEEELVKHKEKLIADSRSIVYATTTISTISGIASVLLEPIVKGARVIVNNRENFFNEIANRKITQAVFPIDFYKYYNNAIINPYNDYSHVKSFVLAGSYFSPIMLNELREKLNLRWDQIVLTYGQTENYGLITKQRLGRGIRYIKYNFEDKDFEQKNPESIYNGFENIINRIRKKTTWKSRINEKNYGYKLQFDIISVGKINPRCLTLSDKPFGEVIIDGIKTGDIGFVDDKNYLFILKRKNNDYSLLLNFLKYCGYYCSIEKQENEKIKLIVDADAYGSDLYKCADIVLNIKEYCEEVLRLFNLSIDDIEIKSLKQEYSFDKKPLTISQDNNKRLYTDYKGVLSSLWSVERKIISLILKDKSVEEFKRLISIYEIIEKRMNYFDNYNTDITWLDKKDLDELKLSREEIIDLYLLCSINDIVVENSEKHKYDLNQIKVLNEINLKLDNEDIINILKINFSYDEDLRIISGINKIIITNEELEDLLEKENIYSIYRELEKLEKKAYIIRTICDEILEQKNRNKTFEERNSLIDYFNKSKDLDDLYEKMKYYIGEENIPDFLDKLSITLKERRIYFSDNLNDTIKQIFDFHSSNTIRELQEKLMLVTGLKDEIELFKTCMHIYHFFEAKEIVMSDIELYLFNAINTILITFSKSIFFSISQREDYDIILEEVKKRKEQLFEEIEEMTKSEHKPKSI